MSDQQRKQLTFWKLSLYIIHQDCFTLELWFPISPSCDAGLSFHI